MRYDASRPPRSEAELTSTLDSIGDAILLTDAEGHVQRMNPAAERWTGWQFGEARDQPLSKVLQCFDADTHLEAAGPLAEALRSGRAQHFPGALLLRGRDGATRRVSLRTSPVRRHAAAEAGDGVLGNVLVLRDVSEEFGLEEKLRRSQRLDTLGLLAGGVAHDFNNLLVAVLGASEMLSLELTDRPDLQSYAQTIGEAAQRAAQLARQLLEMSRKTPAASSSFSLHHALSGVVLLLRPTLGPKVQIETDFKAAEDQVNGDGRQLRSAVVTLALNAREAMPDGGRLSLTTRTVGREEIESGEEAALALPAGSARSYLELAVGDTGSGMGAATRRRLFEPFFSTKAGHEGTGLGLAAVLGTVRDHGGAIRVETEPGRGTRFFLYLPLATQGASVASAPSRPVAASAVRGKILIVDDEAPIRSLGSDMLRHLGYEVAASGDAHEALRWCSDGRVEPDLILVDLHMPGLSGTELMQAIRRHRPGQRAVLVSGFFKDLDFDQLRREGFVDFIQKPYTTRDLAEVVRRALSPE